MSIACPICKKPVEEPTGAEKSNFPFCSERCKLIDLGRWLSEDYGLPKDESEDGPADPSDLE